MKRLFSIVLTLLSYWRKRPVHLATTLIGLIAATALWSGVQALNHQARNSYERAAAIFGGDQIRMLVSRDGPTFSQDLYISLRLAGWRVSPVLEGRVQIAGKSLQLVGIEPVTLPREANLRSIKSSDADLASFLLPPWQTVVSAETLRDLGVHEGATPVMDGGRALPRLTARAELAPGVLVVDIGVAQKLLEEPERVSRLLVSPDVERAAPPLSTIIGDQLRLVGPEEASDLGQLTESFHLSLTAFGLLAFVVGLFIVHSSIGLAFEQRLPMMRTLRACGVSSRALVTALLTELIALALIAGVLGVLGGSLIASALLPDVAASLRGLYGARVAGRLTLEYDWWLAGLSMAVIGALVAAGASLLKSHRLPVLALAQPDAWREAHQRWLRRQGLIAVLCLSGPGAFRQTGWVVIEGLEQALANQAAWFQPSCTGRRVPQLAETFKPRMALKLAKAARKSGLGLRTQWPASKATSMPCEGSRAKAANWSAR